MKAAFPEYDWIFKPTELDPYVTGSVMVIPSNNTVGSDPTDHKGFEARTIAGEQTGEL